MGFSPDVVRKMTFWEFGHAFSAWAVANGNETGAEPTAEEMASLDLLMASAPNVLR